MDQQRMANQMQQQNDLFYAQQAANTAAYAQQQATNTAAYVQQQQEQQRYADSDYCYRLQQAQMQTNPLNHANSLYDDYAASGGSGTSDSVMSVAIIAFLVIIGLIIFCH